MIQYTHPDFPAQLFGNASFTLYGVKYKRVFWRTSSPEEIAALGFVEYVPPEPEPVPPLPPSPPTPHLVATGVFTVTDGWLQGVGAAAGIGMAFALDIGTYWLFFSEPQPDLGYAAPASSSQGQINVQRYLEYVEITVRDASALIDPSEFSITITRAL